jgi:hypothetical protein
MTITRYRYTKENLETVVEFGMGGGIYFVRIDDVVITETFVTRYAYGKLRDARVLLVDAGWTHDNAPAFVGR